jgi:hypothetical protein
VAEAVRAKALALLAAYPYAEISEVVSRALAAQAVEVRRAAVSAVGLARDAGQLETLLAMAEAPRGAGVGVGEALAEALGAWEARARGRAALAAVPRGPGGPGGRGEGAGGVRDDPRGRAAAAIGQGGGRRLRCARRGAPHPGKIGGRRRRALSVVEAAGAEGAVSLENPVPDGPEKADGDVEPMTIALVLGGVAGTAALLVKAVRAAVAHERRYAERLDAIWGEVAARLELRRPQKRLLEGTFQGSRRASSTAGEGHAAGDQGGPERR